MLAFSANLLTTGARDEAPMYRHSDVTVSWNLLLKIII